MIRLVGPAIDSIHHVQSGVPLVADSGPSFQRFSRCLNVRYTPESGRSTDMMLNDRF